MRRKNSLRLKGYDYSMPGEYFVTICMKHRVCILGDIQEGVMKLSPVGNIVDTCWRDIPALFPNTSVDIYQIMPNHVHGIVKIWEEPTVKSPRIPRIGLINQTHTEDHWILMKNPKVTLGKVIRSFKARSARLLHKESHASFRWHRNYHDHIIRDDIDHFFVEQYIELNPLMWYLDADNSGVRDIPIDDLRATLRTKHGLDGFVLERIIEHEFEYREWKERDLAFETSVSERETGIDKNRVTKQESR